MSSGEGKGAVDMLAKKGDEEGEREARARDRRGVCAEARTSVGRSGVCCSSARV